MEHNEPITMYLFIFARFNKQFQIQYTLQSQVKNKIHKLNYYSGITPCLSALLLLRYTYAYHCFLSVILQSITITQNS